MSFSVQLLLAVLWAIAMTALVFLVAGWLLIPALVVSFAFGWLIAS